MTLQRNATMLAVVILLAGSAAGPALAQDAPKAEKAKPGDAKAADVDAKGAEKPVPSAEPRRPSKGVWASIDDFMERTGKKFADSNFMGMRVAASLSETVSYTDNTFYQDANESLLTRLDVDGDGVPASPNLDEPRGEVAELVNTARLSVGLEKRINPRLSTIIADDSPESMRILGASVTSVEYLKHGDSPDALNYDFSVDLPLLLNNILTRFTKVNAQKHAFWFRAEGNYENITDPLDVQQLGFFGAAPTLRKQGNRNDFERTEWWGKGTIGWKGPKFDANVSWKYYQFLVNDDSLESAEHNQQTSRGEVGYTMGDHRVYGFYDFTVYTYDNTDVDFSPIRDFARYKAGAGWSGPVASRKLRGNAELSWVATNNYHEAGASQPLKGFESTAPGTPQGFDEYNGVGAALGLKYRPYVTKGTQVSLDYSRDVTWSVVAQYKVVDEVAVAFSHPINDRLTSSLKYTVQFENVSHREKRLYQEIGFSLQYDVWAYTKLSFEYTFRNMSSSNAPITLFADAANEPYGVQADGDFSANIVSLGLTVTF